MSIGTVFLIGMAQHGPVENMKIGSSRWFNTFTVVNMLVKLGQCATLKWQFAVTIVDNVKVASPDDLGGDTVTVGVGVTTVLLCTFLLWSVNPVTELSLPNVCSSKAALLHLSAL
jgi:hypothetical protein